jgi:quinol-cytochrome oxidoreductase complex cytochrome b subunit
MVKKNKLPQISKDKIKKMWKEKFGKKEEILPSVPFKNYLSYAIVANIIVIVLVLLLRFFLPPQVPLYYGLPESSSQLVPSWYLPIPSLLSLLVIGVNITIAKALEDEFLKSILIFSSIAVTFFSLITTVKIVFLVGNL